MERVMAFGDGENDLDMLKKVGHPVAMENAQDIVKKEINNTAPKNIENGVALYLENFLNFKLILLEGKNAGKYCKYSFYCSWKPTWYVVEKRYS